MLLTLIAPLSEMIRKLIEMCRIGGNIIYYEHD